MPACPKNLTSGRRDCFPRFLVIGDVMGATSTARSRHFRQRKRAGLVRLVVEVDEDGLCEWLVAGGVLSPLDTDQHDKVEQALGRAVTLLIAGNNQP
jgi:hypothetical protein